MTIFLNIFSEVPLGTRREEQGTYFGGGRPNNSLPRKEKKKKYEEEEELQETNYGIRSKYAPGSLMGSMSRPIGGRSRDAI